MLKIREAIVSRPGYAFVSVDWNAIELCTLAQTNLWLFGYSRMAEAINAGQDLHCRLAATMLNEPYEAVAQQVKAKVPRYKVMRQAAKPGNFGFGGFMGAAKFTLTQRKAVDESFPNGLRFCELMRGEKCGAFQNIVQYKGRPCPPICPRCCECAQEIRDGYFRTWEEMNDFQRYVQSQTRGPDGGTLIIPGTKMQRAGCQYSEFANGHFQGLAAVGAKRALWAVTRECYVDRKSALYGSRPVFFVHDEVIAEVPLGVLHDAAYRLKDIWVGSMQETCPDVTIRAEPAAMVRWYKAAEAVFDQNGKLVPWSPKAA